MKRHEYTKNLSAIGYPVRELSDLEKERIDTLNFNFEELKADHIVYALSRAFGSIFHNTMKAIEEVASRDVAMKTAERLGERYGIANYGAFLKSRGAERGTAALMCEFQDKVHSVRGIEHATARFGMFDDEKCVIRRKKCIYHLYSFEDTGKYTEALEKGIQKGYFQVDPGLAKFENVRCLWKGDNGCEHIISFKR